MTFRHLLAGSSLAVALILVGPPVELTAQDHVSLNAVESYLARGRIMEAREILQLWLDSEGMRASRSDRQRSLWLRAKLTVDPSLAELDLRRLVLEFPGGPYSDDSLHRLALFAYSRGDLRVAHGHFLNLVRDYPVSPFRGEAEGWLREHGDEVSNLPDEIPRAAPPGIEPPPEPILTEGNGAIAVQAGAFQSLERARQLAERIREAGFESRLVRVPGSDLVRVRVGRFTAREDADALALELEGRGFDVTIATDAQSEEGVG